MKYVVIITVFMAIVALIIWGLSALVGGLVAPLADILGAMASWLPGSSFALALLVFMGALRLATFPLLLSHTRVDRQTGKVEFWLDNDGLPSGKAIVPRVAVVVVDAVLLFLVAHAVERASAGETQQWLVFPSWGILGAVIFTVVVVIVQIVLANLGVAIVQHKLLSRARRQMDKLGPSLSNDDAIFGIIMINVLVDLFVYLPALGGLCIVCYRNPYRLTIVMCFLLTKLLFTVIAHGLSVWLDWRSDLWQLSEKRTVVPLIEALSEKRSNGQRVVAALGILGDRRAVDPLIEALAKHQSSVRQAAAGALAQLGDKRAVDPLIEALSDDEWWIRDDAAKALGLMGDQRAVAPLIEALSDDELWVRRAAAKALGLMGDQRAVAPLIEALSDKESEVREAAEAALKELGYKN